MTFTSHMQAALDEARAAAARGEVPVGAVVVDAQGRIVERTRIDTATPDTTFPAMAVPAQKKVASVM